MKTLALVLLLTLPAIADGQDTIVRHSKGTYIPISPSWWFNATPRFLFHTYPDTIEVIAAGDTLRTRGNPYLVGFQMLLLSKWDAYKAECYADSALNFYRMSIAERMDSLKAHHKRKDYRWDYTPGVVWRHREPTFSGFMEYLRGKK